jgi:hypothetical protein
VPSKQSLANPTGPRPKICSRAKQCTGCHQSQYSTIVMYNKQEHLSRGAMHPTTIGPLSPSTRSCPLRCHHYDCIFPFTFNSAFRPLFTTIIVLLLPMSLLPCRSMPAGPVASSEVVAEPRPGPQSPACPVAAAKYDAMLPSMVRHAPTADSTRPSVSSLGANDALPWAIHSPHRPHQPWKLRWAEMMASPVPNRTT